MMNELIQLIQQYEHDGCFTHANVSDEMICYAETLLSVKLPEQYKSFLKIYGHGGLDGLEILGVGIAGQLVFVDETIAYRKYGLAQNLVVIENCDEWLYCLDCDNGTVVYWEHGYVEHVFPSFHAYFNDRIHDSIENM